MRTCREWGVGMVVVNLKDLLFLVFWVGGGIAIMLFLAIRDWRLENGRKRSKKMKITYVCDRCGDHVTYNPKYQHPNVVQTLTQYYRLCDDCHNELKREFDRIAKDFVGRGAK